MSPGSDAQTPRPFTDHYAILGLSPMASGAEVHAAYRRARREASADARSRVEKAYQVLGNPATRGRYDRLRGERLAAGPGDAGDPPQRVPAAVRSRAPRRPPPSPSPVRAGGARVPRTTAVGPAVAAIDRDAPLPPRAQRLRGRFAGALGACHGALAGLVVLYAALQPLTWATVATQRGSVTSYSTLGGSHPGLILAAAAMVVGAAEIALFQHRRWWMGRAGSLLFVLVASTTAFSASANAADAAQFLGIPFERATVAITGIPLLACLVALAYGAVLAARTVVVWRRG